MRTSLINAIRRHGGLAGEIIIEDLDDLLRKHAYFGKDLPGSDRITFFDRCMDFPISPEFLRHIFPDDVEKALIDDLALAVAENLVVKRDPDLTIFTLCDYPVERLKVPALTSFTIDEAMYHLYENHADTNKRGWRLLTHLIHYRSLGDIIAGFRGHFDVDAPNRIWTKCGTPVIPLYDWFMPKDHVVILRPKMVRLYICSLRLRHTGDRPYGRLWGSVKTFGLQVESPEQNMVIVKLGDTNA
jgi:hypothetical protein